MKFLASSLGLISLLPFTWATHAPAHLQAPLTKLTTSAPTNRTVSAALFSDLEELARIVDIAYCVGLTSLGVEKPFQCLSRCADFPLFELVTTWNTGIVLSDSCGYIALDHGKGRILLAFRGTYSITNAIVDLSTIPQEYVPYPGPEDGGGEGTASSSRPASATASPAPPRHAAPHVLSALARRHAQDPTHSTQPRCANCTVHMGFHAAWLHTRAAILADVQTQLYLYPHYQLHLVGHSLGGAVAGLAGLDFLGRGWDPYVTTFGEPRIGNAATARFLDERFGLVKSSGGSSSTAAAAAGTAAGTTTAHDDREQRYRRVTHVDDPVPLLPLSEWGYAQHAGEIHISKPALSPELGDVEHCVGGQDPLCSAAQDASLMSTEAEALHSPDEHPLPASNSPPTTTTTASGAGALDLQQPPPPPQTPPQTPTSPHPQKDSLKKLKSRGGTADLLGSVRHELADILTEPWGIPARYKLWQLLFAHRDYFWRLGLCVPGGDPLGNGGFGRGEKYVRAGYR